MMDDKMMDDKMMDGFPIQQASHIALHKIQTFLADGVSLEQVIAVCFSAADLREYQYCG